MKTITGGCFKLHMEYIEDYPFISDDEMLKFKFLTKLKVLDRVNLTGTCDHRLFQQLVKGSGVFIFNFPEFGVSSLTLM